MNRREFMLGAAGITLLGSSLTGCGDTVGSVKEWIVEMATATGDYLQEQSKNLYGALRNAFFKYKIEDGIKFDRDNPLEGICMEDRPIKIINELEGINIEINLKNKKFIRKSEVDPWMIDQEALPPKLQIFFSNES